MNGGIPSGNTVLITGCSGSGVNLSLMKKLATTKEQEDVLERIEQETIPSVRDAWIEYFFKITKRSQRKG